ncbi:MAG: family 78 glycoside hydrolase catalytic domain [Clostridiales bacterium]|nr:family 78 glycoside hydrolase catalytic domain [Clostridiales bacterium]
MNWQAPWIKPAAEMDSRAPMFKKTFRADKPLTSATLRMTGLGVYEAEINGQRVSQDVLCPGWTAYKHRLQVQTYDVTALLRAENTLTVLLGKGWYRSPLLCWQDGTIQKELMACPAGITAELTLRYTDGTLSTLLTDESWLVSESPVRFSELYDGEIYDATFIPAEATPAVVFDGPTDTLIPQEGAPIREQERVHAARIFTTPKGETVVDFGQELTGFLEVQLAARAGDVVDVSFAEVLDRDGNFYNDNYRGAKCQYHYTCREGQQRYKTHLTYYGFRYLRVNSFPGEVTKDAFTGIAVHSDMKRTGHIASSEPMLNQLFSNIIWGQKSNFVDVPTDCPQRDERLGWTGDAQVFARTACTNFDAETFFSKWLRDLAADQHEDGFVGAVIPDVWTHVGDRGNSGCAWGDAATIVPWEVYRAYGNVEMLRRQFPSMCKWVDYIGKVSEQPPLWTGGWQWGDWLGLDSPAGSYKGASRDEFLATAFYARSTALVIRAGKVLGEDVSAYEALYQRIVAAFRAAFPEYQTQTECVLAAHFRLAENPQNAADQLACMVRKAGVKLQTGFIGTPYILHVLSDYGYTDLAYELLLRREYPSWLYPITKGATTIWEHWDGIMPDGGFWSRDMNSFNHYSYGAVADWLYGVAAGIQTAEDAPGYARVRIAPHPTTRLDWLEASIDTRHGLVSCKWTRTANGYRFDIVTPVEAEIALPGMAQVLPAGSYVFHVDD